MLVKKFDHNGKTVEIHTDEDAQSPRDWDNLGVMVCFHKRYNLGDKHGYKAQDFNDFAELKAQIEKDHDPVVILPIYMMDHSGLTLSTGQETFRACDPCGFDWGMVGFIFCPKEKALYEFKEEKITDELKEKIQKVLENEVEAFGQFLSGEVYTFIILDEEGDCIDSCSDLYGFDYTEEMAMAACPDAEDPEEHKAQED